MPSFFCHQLQLSQSLFEAEICYQWIVVRECGLRNTDSGEFEVIGIEDVIEAEIEMLAIEGMTIAQATVPPGVRQLEVVLQGIDCR